MKSFKVFYTDIEIFYFAWDRQNQIYKEVDYKAAMLLSGIRSADQVISAEQIDGGYRVIDILKIDHSRPRMGDGYILKDKWVERD